ncbi:MAG TPA: Imm10 family immunity protein [Pyrinomonadaceae bacterium]
MRADKVWVTPPDDGNMFGAMFSVLSPEGYPVAYWLFGRSKDPEEDDGLVYVERDDQSWSTDGGVEQCRLGRDSLKLCFEESAAAELKSGREVVIQFDLDDARFAALKAAFDSMFQGHQDYEVTAG